MMKELLYKEIKMQKSMMKKNIQSMVLVLGLNIFYYCMKMQTISFTMGIYSALLVSMNAIVNSITMEKSNKMFEKLLTMYRVEKLIGAKLIIGIVSSSVIGCIFSIGNRVIVSIINKEQFDVKMQLLEIAFIILASVFLSVLYAVVYLGIENAMLCNYIVMPFVMVAMFVAALVNYIKQWQLVVGGLVVLLLSFILFKLLGLIKPDKLTKE